MPSGSGRIQNSRLAMAASYRSGDQSMLQWLDAAGVDRDSFDLERFGREWSAIDERYPEPKDAPLRDAARRAAVEYLLFTFDAPEAGRRLAEARAQEQAASAAARQVAVMAFADGDTEQNLAIDIGVNRNRTMRIWLGKPGQPHESNTDYVTPKEAAEILGITREDVMRLIESREIPHWRAGPTKRMARADVLAYKKNSEARSAGADDTSR